MVKATSISPWTLCLPDTPLGAVKLTFTSKGLAGLDFADCRPQKAEVPEPFILQTREAAQVLKEYFAGRDPTLGRLALDLKGTPFQLKVWEELAKIPWGRTISYGELAARLGRPKAARAVGRACAANPIPILIPCHRVIARDGALGGYSAGLERKRRLLAHEKKGGRP